ncbi:MAG: prenyltransferase [Acidimicrobiales bacterium]
MHVPAVEGILSADEVRRTAETIAEWQLPNGMIPWFPGGHADAWNHAEAAMAMATCGLLAEAEAGYQWLADIQRPDGSWHNYYLADGIEDAKLDVNCVAYVATGIWHHFVITGDRGFLEHHWDMIDRATEFVLDLQTKRGEVIWARRPDGSAWTYALLTGSSSIYHSLHCSRLIADALGCDRPHWIEGRDRLGAVIRDVPEAFEPKDRWAMDWYYPVLTGAITGDAGRARLAEGWDAFVMADKGVRCVSDRPWVTAAETCECVMAHLAAGERQRALDLFTWAQALRDDEGRYFTGLVFPELVFFPDMERSTYTAGAVVLAADAIEGTNPTAGLFCDYPAAGSDTSGDEPV